MTNKCTCNQHCDYVACCEDIFRALNDCKYGLKYRADDRSYIWLSPNGKGIGHAINCCPWCGVRLPKYLSEEREEILRNEYGIDKEWDDKQKVKIPAEFKTDEWWKKRGL